MKAWSLILSKEVSVTKEGDHYVDQDGNLWNDFELACLQEDANWKQVRIDAAIAAMPIVADDGYNVRNEQHLIAKYAVQLADELIVELQKKGGQDG